MSILSKALISVGFSFCILSAQALTQSNVPVTFVGSQSAGTNISIGFISLGTSNPNNCLYAGVYFTDEALRKDALVVALASKAFNKLLRIDYTGGSGAMCIGTGVYSQ